MAIAYKGWVHGSIRQHQMQHVSACSEVDGVRKLVRNVATGLGAD